MEKRLFNFSAGPSALPLEVLETAREQLLCYPGAGCSVMEMSHRSASFQAIFDHAQETLRELMNIPDDYAVLFLQGGASLQFSAVPMNLTHRGETTDYVITGHFGHLAIREAQRWGNAVCIASSEDKQYSYIPKITPDMLSPDAKYLHITGNNTIYGSMFEELPETGNVPLVADWSSAILGLEIDVKKHALIYAGAQKNMGPAGLTVVIVKRGAILPDPDELLPSLMHYEIMDKNGSMFNTPTTWSIYVAGLMFDWVAKQGGVAEMEKRNRRKAGMVYEAIDASKIYKGRIEAPYRSIMNVTFTLPTEELTKQFIDEAKEAGLINLKGYRTTGGIRASLYNGMPEAGAEALAEFMTQFERRV